MKVIEVIDEMIERYETALILAQVEEVELSERFKHSSQLKLLEAVKHQWLQQNE